MIPFLAVSAILLTIVWLCAHAIAAVWRQDHYSRHAEACRLRQEARTMNQQKQ